MIVNDIILWFFTIFIGIDLLVFFVYSLCILIDMLLELRDRIKTSEQECVNEGEEDE